jgi:hypothetical protein
LGDYYEPSISDISDAVNGTDLDLSLFNSLDDTLEGKLSEEIGRASCRERV